MKTYRRYFFLALSISMLFALTGCSGASYYGVNSYHGSGWNDYSYNRYDRYYDDRRDRYIDNRNRAARAKYYHQRTNPNRSMRRSRGR